MKPATVLTAIELLMAALTLHAQMPPERAATLANVRAKINATMLRLPKYACIQTIDRSYFTRVTKRLATPSCAEVSDDLKNGRGTLRLNSTDRLRLEVAQGDGREIHSWPGAGRFETGYIDELVNRGPVASGSFGGYLLDIFAVDGPQFSFAGEKMDAGRDILTYSYVVPLDKSHYRVRTADGWAVSSYSGTFDIDAATLELLRIGVDTPELPVETTLCYAQSTLEYSRVHIGDGDFLLPRQSQLHLVQRSAKDSNSVATFTGCREYQAESSVSFDEADALSAASAADKKARAPLPEGLQLTLRLTSAIDSDTAAAGDAVTATVSHLVRDPKTHATLIPPGAVAHGRISRMEHAFLPTTQFIIGILWESVTFGSDLVPFTAIPDRSRNVLMAVPAGQLRRRPIPVGPADALTFPSVEKRHVIHAGEETSWVTIAPSEAK